MVMTKQDIEAEANGPKHAPSTSPRTATYRPREDSASDVDVELDVLRACSEALARLTEVQRSRVLLYLARRFDPPAPIPMPTRNDIPVAARGAGT